MHFYCVQWCLRPEKQVQDSNLKPKAGTFYAISWEQVPLNSMEQSRHTQDYAVNYLLSLVSPILATKCMGKNVCIRASCTPQHVMNRAQNLAQMLNSRAKRVLCILYAHTVCVHNNELKNNASCNIMMFLPAAFFSKIHNALKCLSHDQLCTCRRSVQSK